jgi:hypothetical protein
MMILSMNTKMLIWFTWRWSVGTETCSEMIKENKEKIVGCDCRLYTLYVLYVCKERDCSVSLHSLKYTKTLIRSSTSDVKHVLHAPQLTPWSTCLAMEPLPSHQHVLQHLCPSVLAERRGNSQEHHVFPCHYLWRDFANKYQLPWAMIVKFSRRVAPSSSLLVPQRPLKARPLLMLVFRTCTNCPTAGLLLQPQ